MPDRAVFLDRDGTINKEVHHLTRVDQLQLLPDSAEAIRLLNAAHFRVVIITNQSVVARGLLSPAGLADVHASLQRMLLAEGAMVDGIYHCPHHPTAGIGELGVDCDCRKPRPGMLLQAAEDLNIALDQSYMIGDTPGDLAAGQAAGCQTILVRTGYGAETEQQLNGRSPHPVFVAANLLEAAKWILQQNV